MPTLSLVLLQRLMRRAPLLVTDADIGTLLKLLANRDSAMAQADAIEAVMLRRIGSPALVVVADNQPRMVSTQATLDDLALRGLIGPAETERLGRRLTRRWQQWGEQTSTLGLRGLRRRERRYAHRASKLASRILRKRANTHDQIKTKLALLSAAPAVESKHLLVILDDLIDLD